MAPLDKERREDQDAGVQESFSSFYRRKLSKRGKSHRIRGFSRWKRPSHVAYRRLRIPSTAAEPKFLDESLVWPEDWEDVEESAKPGTPDTSEICPERPLLEQVLSRKLFLGRVRTRNPINIAVLLVSGGVLFWPLALSIGEWLDLGKMTDTIRCSAPLGFISLFFFYNAALNMGAGKLARRLVWYWRLFWGTNDVYEIKVLIEVAAGSCERQRYDEKTLAYRDSHTLPRPYPYPYGFIPGTRAEDGGAVDCYVLTQDPLEPGSLVTCEPVGLLELDEGDERDDKVLATLPGEVVELGEHLLATLRDFIEGIFAQFPEANVQVGRILPKWAALDTIRKYRDTDL